MYSRFEALSNFGEEELRKLKDSKAAIIGLGATGSVIAEHLARHSIELLVVDRDYLEMNDLYSSNIYTPEDCENSLPKALAAKNYLEKFTEVQAEIESLNPENTRLLEGVDLIIDGTDNMETRFLINEFSKKNNIPWIYTSVLGEKGYSMFFNDNCFSCIFEKLSAGSLDTCEVSGVLRETSTISASITAQKAVKYLSGKEVSEKLDTTDGQSFEVEKPGCEVCRGEDYPHLNSERKTVAVCGENKYQLEKELSPEAFEKVKSQGEIVSENKYVLRVKIDGRSIALFSSGRVILEAKDRGHAESLLSEIVGV